MTTCTVARVHLVYYELLTVASKFTLDEDKHLRVFRYQSSLLLIAGINVASLKSAGLQQGMEGAKPKPLNIPFNG